MVTGNESPLTLSDEVFEVTAETITLAPLAVRVPDAVPAPPTTTLPRGRVAGATVSWPVAVVVKWAGPLLTPAHAVKRLRPAKRKIAPAALKQWLKEVCLVALVIAVTHGTCV
jgi:hypothetical protein